MEQELISIVVPVYRAERYIEETMDCVRAQTYPHWELLLVEDCGPDRSREIIEQYIQRTGDTRIRMLTYSTNLGAARARNLGVNEAKGRYLAYLDADDLWTPDKLEKELAFLKENCFPLMDYNGCFYRSRWLPARGLFFLRPGPAMNSPMRMARAPERLSVCRPRLLIKKL